MKASCLLKASYRDLANLKLQNRREKDEEDALLKKWGGTEPRRKMRSSGQRVRLSRRSGERFQRNKGGEEGRQSYIGWVELFPGKEAIIAKGGGNSTSAKGERKEGELTSWSMMKGE